MGIPELIYILCTLTSGLCSVLLLRGYKKSRVRILLWSGLCFFGISINNALVFVDLILLTPETDLSPYRAIVLVAALMIQTYGFIWENK